MNGAGQAWYDRLLNIDRRWIYLLMAIVVIVPAIRPFAVPVGISGEVRSVHDFIEALQPGQVVHLAIDYDPSTLAELHPMAEAILHQCFDQGPAPGDYRAFAVRAGDGGRGRHPRGRRVRQAGRH